MDILFIIIAVIILASTIAITVYISKMRTKFHIEILKFSDNFEKINRIILEQIDDRDTISKVLYHGVNEVKESEEIYKVLLDETDKDDIDLQYILDYKTCILSLIESNINLHINILNNNGTTTQEVFEESEDESDNYKENDMIDITDQLL